MLFTIPIEGRPVTPPGPSPGWNELVARIADSDQEALAALYDASHRLVYSVALRILSDSRDAEEISLDVFTQVWRSAKDFSPSRGSAATWLILITRSRALDRARSRQSRLASDHQLNEAAELPSTEPTPDEAAAIGQWRSKVRTAMAELPNEQRTAIEMAFFAGLSHGDLAARLGEPLGTVKTRIRLGMNRLRQVLGSEEVHL